MTSKLALVALIAALGAFAVGAQDAQTTYLMDRLAIEDLMVRYATAHNTTEQEMYREIFTEDARILLPGGVVALDGLDEILASVRNDRERFNAGTEEGSYTYGKLRQLITNSVVEVDGDAASGTCYVLTIAYHPDKMAPEILSMGRYEDVYVKVAGRWLIEQRTIHIDWGSEEMTRMLEVGAYTPERYRN